MIQICAWCRSEMRRLADSGSSESDISHGICKTCFDNIRFQEGVPLGEYLDSLPAPVYLVNSEGVVTGVNRAACKALGKDPDKIVSNLGGDVFECAFARLPEGCGRTVHCSGCTIRRAVMTTFETGKPQSRVSTVLNYGEANEPTQIPLTITTVKIDSVILLRVDEMAR